MGPDLAAEGESIFTRSMMSSKIRSKRLIVISWVICEPSAMTMTRMSLLRR